MPEPRPRRVSDIPEILGTLSRELASAALIQLVPSQSWSHHTEIMSIRDRPDERYFYLAMSARERWSVRELRRQIDSGLYLRYMSVRRDPEKCLSDDAEQGDLLPFKDHYVLEFLGLSDEHTEQQLRQAILANLRDFFLEFGRDLTFVGEQFAITVGNDTFYIHPAVLQPAAARISAHSVRVHRNSFNGAAAGFAAESCSACAATLRDNTLQWGRDDPSRKSLSSFVTAETQYCSAIRRPERSRIVPGTRGWPPLPAIGRRIVPVCRLAIRQSLRRNSREVCRDTRRQNPARRGASRLPFQSPKAHRRIEAIAGRDSLGFPAHPDPTIGDTHPVPGKTMSRVRELLWPRPPVWSGFPLRKRYHEYRIQVARTASGHCVGRTGRLDESDLRLFPSWAP